ncbi:hypothetical protein ACFLZ2_01335 [Candidatus Margulisiibacteriota bacterium]
MKKVIIYGFAALFLAFIISLHIAGGASSSVKGIGKIAIGMTKNKIASILGQPNSPSKYDFIYGSDNKELIVIFDKNKKVESIIIKGKDLKHSILGISIGSPEKNVQKTFGKPEYIKSCIFFKREMWGYPSSNAYFTLKNGKVDSFAVSCYDSKNFRKTAGKKL